MTKTYSGEVLIENRFLAQIKSSWEKAFAQAHLLPKDHSPIKMIFPAKDQLIYDKAHYLSNQPRKYSTNYMIRIRGKGIRRIYFGWDVIGYTWQPSLNRFCQGVFDSKCDKSYYYVEVDQEPIVINIDLTNA
jgi:hypothetical protein